MEVLVGEQLRDRVAILKSSIWLDSVSVLFLVRPQPRGLNKHIEHILL